MTRNRLIDYCLAKPGAYPDDPFGPDVLIVKVKKRIFAQFFALQGQQLATFNCDRMTGELYRATYPDSVTRGYHCPPIQQPYFNTIRLDNTIPEDIVLQMIDHSYHRVVHKLPKYVQREFLIPSPEES